MAASAAAVSMFSLLSVLYVVIGPVKVDALHCYCALGEAPDCTAVEERINGAVNALFIGGCLRDCSQNNCQMAWYTFTYYTETCPIPINFQTSDFPVGVSRRSYNPICKHCTTAGNIVCPPPVAANGTVPMPTTPQTPVPTIPVAPAVPAPPSVPPSVPPSRTTPIVVPVPVQSVPSVVPVLPSTPLTVVPVVVSMPAAPVSAVLAPTNGAATASVGAPVMSQPAAGGAAAAAASASASGPAASASGAAPSLAMGVPGSQQSQAVKAQQGRALSPLNAGNNAHSVFVPKSLITISAVFITMLLFHVY